MSPPINIQVFALLDHEASGMVVLLIAFVPTIFWIWTLMSCANNAALRGNEKMMWLAVIVFLNFVGAFIYLFVGPGTQPGVNRSWRRP